MRYDVLTVNVLMSSWFICVITSHNGERMYCGVWQKVEIVLVHGQ